MSSEIIDYSKIPNPEVIFLMNNQRINYYDYFPRDCNAINHMQENLIKNAMLDHSYNIMAEDEIKSTASSILTKPRSKSTLVFHEDDDSELSETENASCQTLSPEERPVNAERTSPLTICVKRRSKKIKFDDPTDDDKNFLKPYNKNMARYYPGTENRTNEQNEYRTKNSLAVRMSRAKTKHREEQKGAVHKETKKENVMVKRTVASYLIYLNLLQAALKREEINWTQEWKKQKVHKDKVMSSA